jgi:hypothetical protein
MRIIIDGFGIVISIRSYDKPARGDEAIVETMLFLHGQFSNLISDWLQEL